MVLALSSGVRDHHFSEVGREGEGGGSSLMGMGLI